MKIVHAILVVNTPIISATITGVRIGGGGGSLQSKTVIPNQTEQIVAADSNYYGLDKVIVKPIPKNYGLITYNGFNIKVS